MFEWFFCWSFLLIVSRHNYEEVPRGLHFLSFAASTPRVDLTGSTASPGPLDKRLDWMRKKLVSWQKAFVGRSSFKNPCLFEWMWWIDIRIYIYIRMHVNCKLTIWVWNDHNFGQSWFCVEFSNNMSSHVDGSQWTTVIHHCFFKKCCASLLKKPWN